MSWRSTREQAWRTHDGDGHGQPEMPMCPSVGRVYRSLVSGGLRQPCVIVEGVDGEPMAPHVHSSLSSAVRGRAGHATVSSARSRAKCHGEEENVMGIRKSHGKNKKSKRAAANIAVKREATVRTAARAAGKAARQSSR